MSQHQGTSPNPPIAPLAKSNFNARLTWIAGAVLLVAGVGVGIFWSAKPTQPPRFNDPIEKIARFVVSDTIHTLPVRDQKLYYDCLEERDDDLEAAWETGILSDSEYKAAIERAWFGPQLTNMDKYHLLPTPPEKEAFIDRLLDEKDRRRDDRKDKKTTGAAPDPFDAALARPKPKRDEFMEQVIPQDWPREDRIKWLQYREAIKQRENEREKAAKAAKAAAATTQKAP